MACIWRRQPSSRLQSCNLIRKQIIDASVLITEEFWEVPGVFPVGIYGPYIIEVRNSDGDLIQILKNAFDITLEEAVNSPTRLTFSLPATDPKLYFVTKAIEFWVKDIEAAADEWLVKTKLLRQEDAR